MNIKTLKKNILEMIFSLFHNLEYKGLKFYFKNKIIDISECRLDSNSSPDWKF